MDGDPVLAVMDDTIQVIFTSECLFKIWAEGRTPMRYWNFSTNPDASWNNFDFWLVAVCWLPGDTIGNVAFLRLLRLMRLLKLVGKVKELQLIVMGLANGLNSVQYILILMLLIFYLFAVLGVGSFQKNDPFHFGNLGQSMLTLFRVATLENWSQIFLVNFYGCDTQNPAVIGLYKGKDGGDPFGPDGALGARGAGIGTGFGYFHLNECWHPSSQPLFASLFFIMFVVISSFVMLSLFIGAVCGGMSDAIDGFKANEKIEKKEREEKEALRQAQIAAELAEDEADGLGPAGATDGVAALAEDMDNAHALTTTLHDIPTGLADGDREETELEKAEAAVRLFMSIKRARAGIIMRYNFDKIANPVYKLYLKLAIVMDNIANHPIFVNLITITILAAGVVVGFQTELAKPGSNQARMYDDIDMPTVDALAMCDNVILVIFTIDVVVKVIAEGHRPLHYFADSWNCFDFFIVATAFIFMLPFLPNLSSLLAMLRLLRLLRVLKLVKALPQLRIIIEALISGFGSIFFVAVILFMFFYLYANIGMMMFSESDPMHFGDLQTAMLTLFRSCTLDDWTDVMYVIALGCDKWEYSYGRAITGASMAKDWNKANCNKPASFGWIGVLYMVSFVVVGTMVLLTLFIGVVTTSMEEAKVDQKKEADEEKQVMIVSRALGMQPKNSSKPTNSLILFREIFDALDTEGEGTLNREMLKPLFRVLPLIFRAEEAEMLIKAFEKAEKQEVLDAARSGMNSKTASRIASRVASRRPSPGTDEMKVDTSAAVQMVNKSASLESGQAGWLPGMDKMYYLDELQSLMAEVSESEACVHESDVDLCLNSIDEYYRGNEIGFHEFLIVMEFLRTVEEDPSIVEQLRDTIPESALATECKEDATESNDVKVLGTNAAASGSHVDSAQKLPKESSVNRQTSRGRSSSRESKDLAKAQAKCDKLEMEQRKLNAELAELRQQKAALV